jgi:diguanylate cyclase (GGDEF)-like protein
VRVPSSSLRRRSPTLLPIVFAASLALVAGTALALGWLVTDGVTKSAIKSSVVADSSLVLAFLTRDGQGLDLSAPAHPSVAAAIDADFAALVANPDSGVIQIKVYSPQGVVQFSDRADVVGTSAGDDDELAEALEGGLPVTAIKEANDGEVATVLRADMHLDQVLEEYIPISVGGHVGAVFEVYRDAAPIVGSAAAARDQVVALVGVAAAILSILLYLIFRAADLRLRRQTRALVEAERRDSLTGLLNHGSVVVELAKQLEHSRGQPGAVGIAIVDVDNFRLVNDAHGHAAGDAALLEVARILRTELSSASILGRFGPDEFLVIAPPECAHDLEPAIERMRVALAATSVQFGASERLPLSVSAGLCYAPVDGDAATELLSVATVTLREAKASGGDAIRVAETTGDDRDMPASSSFDVLQGLVIAVDTKDRYTKRHSEDVARYALFIADRIGLEGETRRALGVAGLLHDVGKIGIPDTILRKPAALTAEEYAIVKQHVALGDLIVRDVPNLSVVRGGVRHHHERWDGHGYLDGLAGEEIPLVARILAVADAFSAMTTTRPYRKALGIEEAIRRLEDAAGSQLDPTFVVAFVEGLRTASDAPMPGMDRPTPLLWTPRADVA